MTRKWDQAQMAKAVEMAALGLSHVEIGERMGRTAASIGAMLGRIREGASSEDPKLRNPTRTNLAAAIQAISPKADPVQACYGHWRDLDKHHPSGWPSYRITTEFRSQMQPTATADRSFAGSPAADCAGF